MQPLGLTPTAEAAYRAVLRQPEIADLALAQALGLKQEALSQELTSLQQAGLLRRSLAGGWLAAPPEVAVELLLMARQAELNQARRILPLLQADSRQSEVSTSATEVQVLQADPSLQLHTLLKLFESARQRICSLVRPPFIVAAPGPMEAARDAARKRGVRIQTILTPEVLAWDGWRAAVMHSIELGDEIRILDELPFKLLLVDEHAAMLPLLGEQGAEHDRRALLVRNCPAALAVSSTFDRLWQRAVPAVLDKPAGDTEEEGPDLATHTLLTLLASGANDKAIAHALGLSERTLQRRMSSLMEGLEAKSRFQAGWIAAKQHMPLAPRPEVLQPPFK